jgi:hypothetical protein
MTSNDSLPRRWKTPALKQEVWWTGKHIKCMRMLEKIIAIHHLDVGMTMLLDHFNTERNMVFSLDPS